MVPGSRCAWCPPTRSARSPARPGGAPTRDSPNGRDLRHWDRVGRSVTVEASHPVGRCAVTTFVYDFAEGSKDQADLLGGKGANLAEMTRLGLPVPPGFIVSTDACRVYLATGAPPAGLDAEIDEHLRALEQRAGRRLGDPGDPLLLSV